MKDQPNNKPSLREDISWYLNRLSRMSFPEIAYRLSQGVRKKLDQRRRQPWPLQSFPSQAAIDLSRLQKLSAALDPKAFVAIFPKETAQLIRKADRLLANRFEVFGIPVHFGRGIDWHLDPITNKRWPMRFWGKINIRNAKKVGCPKFVWEINRLYCLTTLGIAFWVTGQKKYGDKVLGLIYDWFDHNPYPFGVNWTSGIEVGLRIANLVWALSFLRDYDLTARDNELINRFVFAHARHLERYPSKYSSNNNHALAEALGLFVARVAFSSLQDAHKWKTFGKEILESEVQRQIYPDGSSFEHTIPYLQFVADHFLIYYIICKHYNEMISDSIEARLKAVCDFISCIVDINGNIPMIGDDDDGYLLKLWFEDHNNFLSLLNTGSILFNRPDWVHPAASLDTKTLLLVGGSAKPTWEKLKKEQAWCRKSCYLENAGLAIIAHSKSEKEILFVGNSGRLGLKPLGGHGHADALGLWLSVDGLPFFVDPGTYLYHSGGKWRRYFRSTAAHNTVQIDGKDQARQLADFMFKDFYRIHNVQWQENTDKISWGAEHDGYCRLSDPVVHRREVTYQKNEFSFQIIDILNCRGIHNVKLLFHLHPDVRIDCKGKNTYLLSRSNTSLTLKVDDKLDAHVFHGSEDPLMGWYSPAFNRLEKSHSLVFRKNIKSSISFETEIRVI